MDVDAHEHPATLLLEPELAARNRLTVAFRILLAVPHLLLVGGPMAASFLWGGDAEGPRGGWAAGGGALGAVAALCALIAWFAIVFTGRHPAGLWRLGAFYLTWRTKAVAYVALLTDAYPPFGSGPYPAHLRLAPPPAERNRLTVAFRLVLAIPQLLVVFLLSVAWAVTTIVAWFAILFTGRYPEGLYRFGTGVLGWTLRVESYLLLLHDTYPPFELHPSGAVHHPGPRPAPAD